MRKLNCFILLAMVLVNLSWADVTTTNSPSQETTAEVVVAVGTEAVDAEAGSGSGDHSSNQNEAVKPVENLTCSAAGVHADASNCQLYQECSATASAEGSLQLVTKSCPEREAFSVELKRCSREISACQPPVHCLSKGVIADPESNSTYYLCQPKFGGSGFYIFRVYCGKSEVFYPSLGICLSSLEDFIYNGLTGQLETSDFLTVKHEILELKMEYKKELKREKLQQKKEEKLQKKIEKDAERAAKLENKIQTNQRKLEATSYECVTEGNFPSQVADHFYIGCILQKNKIVAIPLECSVGAKFEPQTGICKKVNSSEENSSGSEK